MASSVPGAEAALPESRGWQRAAFVPLRLKERRFLCASADLLSLLAGILAVILAAAGLDSVGARYVRELSREVLAWQPGGSPALWFILLVAVWFPVASAFGVYDAEALSSVWRSAVQMAKAILVSLALYVLIPFATPFLVSRSILFTLAAAVLLIGVAVRVGMVWLLGQARFQQRTLIVGAGWAGRTALDAVTGVPHSGYQVVGFVDDDPAKLGLQFPFPDDSVHRSRHAGEGGHAEVLGDRRSIQELAYRLKVSVIVLAITHEVDSELMQILFDCLEHGVEIVPMPVLYEELTGRVAVEHVGNHWYVALPVTNRSTSPLHRVAKRGSDILLAGIGAALLLPFLPFLALAIYLESPGPVFYRQERMGRQGRRFMAWKFRSMKVDAEKDGVQWASENDSRVTRVGRILRKTHVDEFPQFWNILRGEMSAVGPRPERPEFVERLEKEIPFYRTRLMVKPGMAGWGLVKQGYGASKEDALVKLQYDLYYIKHQSIFLDLVILLKTVIDTVTFGGR